MASYQDLVDRFVYGEGLLSTPPADFDPSQGGTVSGGDRQRAFAGTLANMAQNISTANQKGVGTGGLLAAAASGMTEGREFYKNTVEERARQRQQYTQSQQDRDAWRAIFNGDADPANLPAGVTAADAAAMGIAGPDSGVSSALLARGQGQEAERFGNPIQGPDGNWYQQNLTTGQYEPMGSGGRQGPLVQIGDMSPGQDDISQRAGEMYDTARLAVDANLGIAQTVDTMGQVARIGAESGWSPGFHTRPAAFVQGVFNSLGLEEVVVDENAGITQAVIAGGNQLALYLRNPASGGGLTGNTSNKDLKFLLESIPGVSMTPEGFYLTLEIMKKKHQFAVDYQRAKAEEIYNNNGRISPEFDDEWQQKGFLSADDKIRIKAILGHNAPRPSDDGGAFTEEDYRALDEDEMPAGVN